MKTDNRLLEMLTGYAAAHQHPFNIFVHLVGIPTIMLGVLIPLTWMTVEVETDLLPIRFTPAHLVLLGFFIFYLSLDGLFALAFLIAGYGLTMLAMWIGDMGLASSGTIAAVCFFGGYAAQFIGHAVERSMPVLVKHPIQANLAAPFFTVVEIFKLLGLREELFNTVQREIAARREQEAAQAS